MSTQNARKTLASEYSPMLADEVKLEETLPFEQPVQAYAVIPRGIRGRRSKVARARQPIQAQWQFLDAGPVSMTVCDLRQPVGTGNIRDG
jgi:hypothetical protein